mgnify:CR=1 FL=1
MIMNLKLNINYINIELKIKSNFSNFSSIHEAMDYRLPYFDKNEKNNTVEK